MDHAWLNAKNRQNNKTEVIVCGDNDKITGVACALVRLSPTHIAASIGALRVFGEAAHLRTDKIQPSRVSSRWVGFRTRADGNFKAFVFRQRTIVFIILIVIKPNNDPHGLILNGIKAGIFDFLLFIVAGA